MAGIVESLRPSAGPPRATAQALARSLALPIALTTLIVLYVIFAVAVAWHETLDDAAISFAYAKNLTHGNGLVLTEGAAAVEGYSNFLWVLVMVPFYAAGFDLVVASKVLGLALSVGALVLLVRVPSRTEARGVQFTDLLAVALAAVSLPFALWSVSGLENGLETFLLVLAVSLSLRELDDSRVFPWSGLVFFALALTRPEGVAFWFAAVGHRALLMRFGRRLSRADLAWFAMCLVPLGIYHAWHYAYFGELVPNTYFAKAHDRSLIHMLDYVTDPDDRGVRYVRSFITDYWMFVFAPIALLSLAGRRGLMCYSLPLLLVLTGVAATLFEGGDWMQYHRFLTPIIPLFYLCVQEGVRAVSRASHRPDWQPWVLAGGVLLTLAAFLNLTKADDARARPFGAPYDTVLARARILDDLGHRLGVERPTVVTPDIGGAAFGTGMSVIDLAGLADTYIARHPAGPLLGNYLFVQRKPDIIWLHRPWGQSSGLDQDPRLRAGYVAWQEERDPNGVLASGTFVRNDLLLLTTSCLDAVRWQDVRLSVGKEIMARGSVVAIRQAPLGTLILDIGVEGRFAVEIHSAVQATLPLPAQQIYMGKTICVRGTVELLAGVPSIVVTAPDAITLSDEL